MKDRLRIVLFGILGVLVAASFSFAAFALAGDSFRPADEIAVPPGIITEPDGSASTDTSPSRPRAASRSPRPSVGPSSAGGGSVAGEDNSGPGGGEDHGGEDNSGPGGGEDD